MLIDCLNIRDRKLDQLKKKIEKLNANLNLTIIIVGDNYASEVYVKNKIKLAKELNIQSELIRFNNEISTEQLKREILKLNTNNEVDGILLQLPLPSHIEESKVTNVILPEKDVDGFTYENIGKLSKAENKIASCTPSAVIEILRSECIDLEGKNVLIASRSNIVGKPLALMCINASATVTVANSKTKNLKKLIEEADIFITAIGSAKFFTAKYFENISKELVVIDIGINRDENDKLCGDVDTLNVEPLVKAITPVPKGVGPLTVVEVFNNLITLKENR